MYEFCDFLQQTFLSWPVCRLVNLFLMSLAHVGDNFTNTKDGNENVTSQPDKQREIIWKMENKFKTTYFVFLLTAYWHFVSKELSASLKRMRVQSRNIIINDLPRKLIIGWNSSLMMFVCILAQSKKLCSLSFAH